MLTFVFRRSAAAGLFTLALAASLSPAYADWTITGSCVGGWRMRNCVINKRDHPRDTNLRQVRSVNADISPESAARDRKWLNFCKPVLATDNYGVEHYHYAHAGCEYGRSE